MATLILKALTTSYVLTVLTSFFVFGEETPFYANFFMPIFIWPVTLGIFVIALLIFIAIEENK